MTRCRGLSVRLCDLTLVALGELLSRPIVWSVAVLAICLGPAVSLSSVPGLARAPRGEVASLTVQVATCTGVGCGLWLAVEHAWLLGLLARRTRFALEWCLVLGGGATCALASSVLSFVLHAQHAYLAAGWCVWVESSLALLLIQLRWRGPAVVFVFVALAWVLPAAIPAPAAGHRALDFAYRIAQDLSPVTASSDKTALNLFDLAPSAALLLMAWLLSRSGRR